MATELAKAYVQIIPSAEGITGKLGSVMGGEAESAGKSSGESLAKTLGESFKKAFAALGIAKVISDAIGNTSEFETGMAKVKTLFQGTDAEFQKLQSDMLGLSSSYGVSVKELTDAAYSAESAGVSQQNLMKMLENSAQLAKAGFTDLDTALSATAKTMNAYGDKAGSIEEIQKVLIQTQNLGITTVGELGASLANVTPTAAAMGVSFDQVGAALALMTAKGTPTAQATTQLRAAMVELGKQGTKGSKALEEAAKAAGLSGTSFKELIGNGASLGDIMNALQQYADKTGVSMVDLFSSVEAGNAAMAIASDVETFTKDLQAMGAEADVVGEGYNTMAGTFGEAMNKMKNSFSNLGIALATGIDIGPAMDTLISSLTEVLSGAGTMIFTMVKGIFDNLPQIFSSLVDMGSDLLQKLMEIDWGSLATTVIGAIGELLPGFLTKGGEIVSNLVSGMLENAPSILSMISEAMGGVISKIGEALPDLLSKGSEITSNLLSGLNENAPGIAEAIGTILESISEAIAGAFPAISTGIADIVSAFKPLVSEITSSFENVVSTITTAIKDIIAALAPYIPEITKIVTQTTSKLPDIINAFDKVVGTISKAITDIVAALAPYIPDITKMVTETTKQLPNIISAFNDIAETIGKVITDIAAAIAPYIPDITKMVETTVQTLPDIIAAFQGVFDSIGPIIDSIGEVIAKIGTAVTEIVESVGTNIKTIVDSFSGLLTSLEGPITSIGSLIESIGKAIGTVVEAVGKCVASINESFAKVLDSLKGVIDSIGEGAVKAGQGFSSLADAIIKLVNQTGFFDLAATLTKVAGAVGDIARTGRDAGDAYTNLQKLVETLASLADQNFGTMSADLQTIADKLYTVTLYTPTLKDTKANLDDLGKVKLSNLVKELEASSQKFKDLATDAETGITKIKTAVSTGMKEVENLFKTTMANSKAAFAAFDWAGIGKDLTNRIRDGIVSMKENIATAFTNIMTDAKNAFNAFDWAGIGRDLTNRIRDGINDAKNNVATAFTTIMTEAKNAFTAFDWLGIGKDLTNRIRDGIDAAKSNISDAFDSIMAGVKSAFDSYDWESLGKNLTNKIKDGINSVASNVTGAMETIVADTAAKFTSHDWGADGKNAVDAIKSGISNNGSGIASAMGEIVSDAAGKWSAQDWNSIGKNACAGIKKGIEDNAGGIKDALKAAAEAAVSAAQAALEIESPSKVMRDEVGQWIPKGIAAGIEKYSGSIDSAMRDIADGLTSSDLQSSLTNQSFGLRRAANGIGGTAEGFSQVINISSPEPLDPSEIARQTRIQTQNMRLAMMGV